jgi:hypothetical protein
MKKGTLFTLAGLAIIIAAVAAYYWKNNSSPPEDNVAPTTTTTTTTPTTEAEISNCTADDLQATIQLVDADGEISGPIGITNISSTNCIVNEDVIVKVLYPTSITNLKVEQGDSMTLTLSPEQGMMNMVSITSSAQCPESVGASADFFVEVNGEEVKYAEDNDAQIPIEICEDESVETLIKLSGFYTN